MRCAVVLAFVLTASSAHSRPDPDPAQSQLDESKAPVQPDEPKARAKDLYTEATKRYDLHDYAAAIELLRKAYDLFPDAVFLFDIAQAYRQLHDCEKARSFYKTYLRNLPTADDRDKVERFITDMDDCLRVQDMAPAAARGREAPMPITVVPRARHRGLVVGGIAATLAGAGIAAGGIYFSIDASNQARMVEKLCQFGCNSADAASIDEQGRSSNRKAIVLYAIGGAAIGAGIGTLLWVALHRDDSVIVAPTPSGATVSTRMRF